MCTTMEVGTVSPDGHYQWDGTKWIPVQLTKVSDDGFWMWNGSDWMPNPNPPFEKETSTEKMVMHSSQTDTIESPSFPTQHIVQPMYYSQPKRESRTAIWVLLCLVIPVFLIALTVVLSGVLYVWASSLAEGNDQAELSGTWYNSVDTMTLYNNGTVSESSGLITEWTSDGYNLTTTFSIDGEEVDLVWRYELKVDSDGDQILFMAYYDSENGVQTSEVADESCVAYIDSVRGSEKTYFDNKWVLVPDWCDEPSE